MPKGLLLSAYDAGSHRYWRKGIVKGLSEYDWTVLTLPARYFSWRIRGNPISFLEQYGAELLDDYDFIVATSMVDLATLKGIVPSLANTPSLVYFHENQFEYPKTAKQKSSIEPQMVNLYSALSADSILFNSDFNRRSFFSGCDELMAKLPDHAMRELSAQLNSRSSVIPVPIDDILFFLPHPTDISSSAPIKIIWNHRWEYDKGPDRLLQFVIELNRREVVFELNIVGESFRQVPDEFAQIKRDFPDNIKAFGYVDNVDDYRALLSESDVVVSTSIHEFQGVSVMEAVSAGCLPLVPDRLSYQELVPEVYRYSSFIDSPAQEAKAAVDRLQFILSNSDVTLRDSFKKYSWSVLIEEYRRKIQRLLNQ